MCFVSELINMFGLEIILIYTAMLLRKRVVVYHHSLQALQKVLYMNIKKKNCSMLPSTGAVIIAELPITFTCFVVGAQFSCFDVSPLGGK